MLVKLCQTGKYIVSFDPLDGSSIIDSNLAIGTILAIWKKREGTDSIVGYTAREDMVGAALSCYGSRTNIVIYNTDKKAVQEYTLQADQGGNSDDNTWNLSKENMFIEPTGHFFSPGNAKSMKYNKGYKDCIEFWAKNGYVLRYSGGMAPDCFHVINRGAGVFSSVSYKDKVKPKLRFLYEVAPIGFLAEMAGGSSSDGKISIMDVKCTGYDHIHDIIIGSSEEVSRCIRFLNVYEDE